MNIEQVSILALSSFHHGSGLVHGGSSGYKVAATNTSKQIKMKQRSMQVGEAERMDD